jgi:predicted ATP-dependent Lon-type protease
MIYIHIVTATQHSRGAFKRFESWATNGNNTRAADNCRRTSTRAINQIKMRIQLFKTDNATAAAAAAAAITSAAVAHADHKSASG